MHYTYKQIARMTGEREALISIHVRRWGIRREKTAVGRPSLVPEDEVKRYIVMAANNIMWLRKTNHNNKSENCRFLKDPRFWHNEGQGVMPESVYRLFRLNGYYLKRPICAQQSARHP